MDWIKTLYKTEKPIIAMLHLLPMPSDPNYDPAGGMDKVIERAKRDIRALQNGGVDAILVCNEYSLPYLYDVEPCTVAAMAYLIGVLSRDITVPYGVDVATDPYKVYDLAAGAKALFVRETFTGAYAGDYGVVSYEMGKIHRHRAKVGAKAVRTLCTLVPECSRPMADRPIEEVAHSTDFYFQPDAYLVSGLTAGCEADSQIITRVKKATSTPVFANNGVRLENVDAQLAAADGCIIGTTFKRDGCFYNEVDESRVARFMDRVREIRGDA